MPNPKKRYRKIKRRIGLYSTLNDIEDSKDNTRILIQIGKNAAINAINENIAMDIPIIVVEDGWIVKKTADGKSVKISPIKHEVSNRKKPLTKGTILHVKGYQ